LDFLEKTKGTEREAEFNRCVLGVTLSLLAPEKQKSLQNVEHSYHSGKLNPEDFILSIEKALSTSGIRGITS